MYTYVFFLSFNVDNTSIYYLLKVVKGYNGGKGGNGTDKRENRIA